MNVSNFPFRFNHSPNILEGALYNKIKNILSTIIYMNSHSF